MGSNIYRRRHEPIYKTHTEIEAKTSELQLLLSQSWKSDNFMGSNRVKSNIAIAILGKIIIVKG